MSDQVIVAPDPADLAGLEAIWVGELSHVYESYLELSEPRVALAAAMVDTATRLQNLGGLAPGAAELLIGDLCLARASRLLAELGDMRLQVAFARAIEQASAAAAAEEPRVPVRDLLSAAIREQA
jgi:hypothetical protein